MPIYAKERMLAARRLEDFKRRKAEGRVMSKNGSGAVDYTKGSCYVWAIIGSTLSEFTMDPRKDYSTHGYTFIGELYNGVWMSTLYFRQINYNRSDLKSREILSKVGYAQYDKY